MFVIRFYLLGGRGCRAESVRANSSGVSEEERKGQQEEKGLAEEKSCEETLQERGHLQEGPHRSQPCWLQKDFLPPGYEK